MSDWKPIETAPKDGTDILVAEFGDVKIAFWSGLFRRWSGPRDAYGDIEVMTPTHWMSLPDAPK